MQYDMSPNRAKLDRLINAVAFGLMLATGAAFLCVTVATFSPHRAWRTLGALMALPALVWILLPVLAVFVVLTIWTIRAFAPNALGKPRAEPLDLLKKPQAEAPTISEIDLLKIVNQGGDPARRPVDWQHAAHSDNSIENPVAPTTFEDIPAIARRHNIHVQKLDTHDYRVAIPSGENAFKANSDLERTCLEFLQNRNNPGRIVIDGRDMEPNMFEGLCDMLCRLVQKMGEVIFGRLTVEIPSSAFIEYLYRVLYAGSGKKQSELDLYTKVLRLCYQL